MTDKPGTTGETLEVLTHSLSDLDHKIHIVLNKVDLFANVSGLVIVTNS